MMEGMRSQSVLLTLVALSACFMIWVLTTSSSPPAVVSFSSIDCSLKIPSSAPLCPAACSLLEPRPASFTANRLDLSLRQRFVDGMLDVNAMGLATFTNAGVSATWVPMNGFIVAMLSHYQRLWGISGAAGEIGVHWADYFIPIAITARQDELLWVLDVFEQQEKNVDRSGQGDYNIFMSRCSTLSLHEGNLLVSKMASTEMTTGRLCVLVPQRFRFLSIDGGHSRGTVYSDLAFAECQLADGGIAAVDDYSHAYWPGVHEGVVSYFNDHPDSRLAPFLLANNKLYITTKTHHLRWLHAMTHEEFWDTGCLSRPFCIEAPGKNGGNFAKFQLAGSGIAVAEHRHFNLTVAHQKWSAWLDAI
ncbi:hypothetical protein FOA52_013102 [Chlamydomonas sp. UWO 241]|nr:hypothetical protein FOA52_013102 [Chlamydomonas sp. UWO 241]